MAEDSTAVVWFRRDFRLSENPAWSAATIRHERVVPVVVLDPDLLDRVSDRRARMFRAHVAGLSRQLTELDGGLTVRLGRPADVLPGVVEECGASVVYINRDASPFGRARDAEVESGLGAPIVRHDGLTAHRPGSVLTASGTLSQVFSAFHKRWSATPLEPWPSPGPASIAVLASDTPAAGTDPLDWPAGEEAALGRLARWTERVDDYASTRESFIAGDTSRLSIDLKFGAISARTILDMIGTHTPGRAAFARQLAWRDWWAHHLMQRPGLVDEEWSPRFRGVPWNDDARAFALWQRGETGYPLIDAGMRELAATGWMNNRLRMVTASFLVKDLLVDWRRGERHFRHELLDGDVSQNVGNWQWVAGTGPDAAPFFRVFNPVRQSRTFDPDGGYIRRWVPELAALRSPWIHEPWTFPPLDLAAAGVTLGESYPAPIVDHRVARQEALDAYEVARQSNET